MGKASVMLPWSKHVHECEFSSDETRLRRSEICRKLCFLPLRNRRNEGVPAVQLDRGMKTG
jgi:hypothetical protein